MAFPAPKITIFYHRKNEFTEKGSHARNKAFFQAGLCAVTAVSSSVLRFGSQIQSTEKQYGNATTSLKMSINVKLRI